MKKACMRCKEVDREFTWEEKYEVADSTDVGCYLLAIVDRFNSTLRTQESAREIVEIWEEEIGDNSSKRSHSWEKTNLATKMYGGRVYDTYKCTRCGVTGKRYGLSATITLDSKYKAAKYKYCE